MNISSQKISHFNQKKLTFLQTFFLALTAAPIDVQFLWCASYIFQSASTTHLRNSSVESEKRIKKIESTAQQDKPSVSGLEDKISKETLFCPNPSDEGTLLGLQFQFSTFPLRFLPATLINILFRMSWKTTNHTVMMKMQH